MKNIGLFIAVSVAIAGPVAAPLAAHHSYAMFDANQTRSFSGTVKKWAFANPHALLIMTVEVKPGRYEDWSFECRSTGELTRQGLRSVDIKVGDKMVVTGNPAVDGRKVAGLVSAVTAGGKKFGKAQHREDNY